VLRTELGIPALLLRHGTTVGFALPAAGLLIAYAVCVLRLPRTAAGFAVGGALVELVVDVTNKQSYFNHYTLPMALLVIGLAAQQRPAGRHETATHARAYDTAA
jgi:hypothetical protein